MIIYWTVWLIIALPHYLYTCLPEDSINYSSPSLYIYQLLSYLSPSLSNYPSYNLSIYFPFYLSSSLPISFPVLLLQLLIMSSNKLFAPSPLHQPISVYRAKVNTRAWSTPRQPPSFASVEIPGQGKSAGSSVITAPASPQITVDLLSKLKKKFPSCVALTPVESPPSWRNPIC